MILVTGAAGQVGLALVRWLRIAGHKVVSTDTGGSIAAGWFACDLRSDRDVERLFETHRFAVAVHLAAVLPTAFRADPLTGGEVNLAGTMRLLRGALDFGVGRFVFASSASVYGNSDRGNCTERSDLLPDEPYGASKVAIEKILELMRGTSSMETVSVRIARVLGPGARRTGSPWRSQMFERPVPGSDPLMIPFTPDARLSVVHVEDLAEALQAVVEAPSLPSCVYNAPAEVVTAQEIKHLAEEANGWKVSLGGAHGGPMIDSGRFAEDFRFFCRPLAEHLSAAPKDTTRP